MMLKQLEPQIQRATCKYHRILKIPRYHHRIIKDPQTQGRMRKILRQLTGKRPYSTSKTTIEQDQEYLVETHISTRRIEQAQKKAKMTIQEPEAVQRRRLNK